MKIVLINGSPRKGNTYYAAKRFLNEMAKLGDITCIEHLLPRDMPEFCAGCGNCFDKGEDRCPHAKYTLPILDSMIEADALVLISPVFVWQTTAAMKNFLDHFAHLFMVHRPREEMFSKKAFVLSTAAGVLKNLAIKPIARNLKLWGINRVYSQGFNMRQMNQGTWDAMEKRHRKKLEETIKKNAKRFYRKVNGKRHAPYVFTRVMVYVSRRMIKAYEADRLCDASYWTEKGWMKSNPLG
ncbi:MAG: NAD(P)H-dependent oxidoreductase [Clostridia bacterium]|nr:NAD(P)H-dependent oxidoreductase [Clostridia bacterium]